MVVLKLATADGPLGSAVGTTATGRLGLGVGPVGAMVAVAVGGAFKAASATTVWAACVWIMPTSCAGTGAVVGAGVAHALSTRLSARSMLTIRMGLLRFLFMVFLSCIGGL